MEELELALAEMSDVLIKHFNPCQIKDGSCAGGSPVPCCQTPYFDPSRPCPYINDCKNHITLDCRLWFCKSAIKNMDDDVKQLFFALDEVARKNNLIVKPFLGDPYYGQDKF